MINKKMDELIESLGHLQVFSVGYILMSLNTLCQINPNTSFTAEEIHNSILWRPIEMPDDGSFTVEHLKKILDKLSLFHFVEEEGGKFSHKDNFNLSVLVK